MPRNPNPPIRHPPRCDFRGLLPTLARLTDRQNEVCRYLCLGMSCRQIADELHISSRTVEDHLRAIYDLIGVDDDVGAVAALYRAREGCYVRFIDAMLTPLAESRFGFQTPDGRRGAEGR
jgi:DNA-binding NarL/FixJ family response regulator